MVKDEDYWAGGAYNLLLSVVCKFSKAVVVLI
jgi:hypothetical protein